MRNGLLLVGVATFAATLTLLCLRRTGPARTGPSPAVAVEPRGETAPSLAEAVPTTERATGSGASANGERRSARPEDSSPWPDGPTAEVVARTQDGAAAAGAWVWWLADEEKSGESSLARWLREDTLDERCRATSGLRADERGWVTVPAGPAVIVAELGTLWGGSAVELERGGRLELTLRPDAELRVRVQDPRGDPLLDVPVVLRIAGASRPELLRAHSSGPHGLAVLHHAGHQARQAGLSGAPLVVAVPALVEPPVQRVLEASALPTEVTLVLEPTGSVELEVVDPDGLPLAEELEGQLRLAAGEHQNLPAPPRQHCERARARAGQRLVFPLVALGRQLIVAVSTPEAERVTELRLAGPTQAGERVRLRVPLEMGRAQLAGRLIDDGGLALAGVALRARLESAKRGTLQSLTRLTGEDGRFQFACDPCESPGELRLVLQRLGERGELLAGLCVDLEGPLDAGLRELGDLRLSPMPLLVAGVVRNEQGATVAGAEVGLVDVPGLETEAGEARGPAPNAVRTDAQGRFAIRGEVLAPEVALTARRGEAASRTLVTRTGREGVELVLEAPAAIAGWLVLPERLSPADLRLVLECRGAPDSAPVPCEARPVWSEGLRFRISGLVAGSCDLRVLLQANGAELARVNDLRVSATRASDDPRLAPLDLRQTTRAFELLLVDELGQPVHGGRARVGGAERQEGVFSAQGDRILLWSGDEPGTVEVSAPGFLQQTLEAPRDGERIVLRRAARVRFVLEGVQVPEPPLRLGLTLTPPGRPAWTAEGSFDARGELSAFVPFDGSCALELVLVLDDGVHWACAPVPGTSPARFEVGAPGRQVLVVRVDPLRLRAAATSLEEEH